jgi:hypothetical protein
MEKLRRLTNAITHRSERSNKADSKQQEVSPRHISSPDEIQRILKENEEQILRPSKYAMDPNAPVPVIPEMTQKPAWKIATSSYADKF